MKIKLCGLFQNCDIDFVNEAKPDFIGFVFAKSRRQVSAEWAKAMRPKLSSVITPVGVFVNESVTTIAKLLNEGVIEMAQLHGNESEIYIRELKTRTKKPIIRAVQVISRADIEEKQDTVADFLLLDHGAGGTGESFDWSIVGQVKKPFFLAGGLKADNIEQAIRAAKPFAVDLSSGVETDGKKDRGKILEIVRRMRNE
ncbi:phosphoribosylanthranilate isomerase [Desulfosporosinus acidiphilus SJ4]|uniref:N-(5'-phosphoribosyl)anthranilate isomerase n=1 Tax=Desulfosporosinus acidiphilus (strain DSM 22704 / JCM 16185 / SJ4) TaxID=646529 RepID=I4D283_DESAJ|nr:phosphoribosylanthranilate isomerase [Desulfosporosinus acidiphilus]AFM39907.1 phosphoribosylanthranilate isomerase [Desulfosporosinus acidiphilus SJ4]